MPSASVAPYMYLISEWGTQRKKETYLSPGVFGLETLITNTSAYGPNASTPVTKSAIESTRDALFLPKLTARTEPGRWDAGASTFFDWNGEIRVRSRDRTDP